MANLCKLQVSNFRSISQTDFLKLGTINVFIGGNNSGKTSVFKALLLAKFGVSTLLRRMVRPRDNLRGLLPSDSKVLEKTVLYVAQGDLEEFSDLPVEDAESLFRLRKRSAPITLVLDWDNGWGITLRFTRPTGHSITIEPVEIRKNGSQLFDGVFPPAGNGNRAVDLTTLTILGNNTDREQFLKTLQEFAANGPVLVPCTVGMPLREDIVNYGRVSQLIASGRVNLTIRNVIRFIPKEHFEAFRDVVQDLFGFTLYKPLLDEERDTSVALPYLEQRGGSQFASEAAELGSGAQQIIYLLAFIYRNLKAQQFLLDEPEAHLHPYYVSKLVDALLKTVTANGQQLFLATHSDVLIRTLRAKANDVHLFSCDGVGGISEITEATDLVAHLVNIGYDDANLPHTLGVLRKSGRVAFVEGPFDRKMLIALLRAVNSKLAETLERDVAFIPLRGTGQSKLALVGGVGFLASLIGTLKWKGLVLFDRDFIPPDRMAAVEGAMTSATADETGGRVQKVVLHRVCCIENLGLLDRTTIQDHFGITEVELNGLLSALAGLHDAGFVDGIVKQGAAEARKIGSWSGQDLPKDYATKMLEHVQNVLLDGDPWRLLVDYSGRKVLGHLLRWKDDPHGYVPTARDPGVPEQRTTAEFLQILTKLNPATYTSRLAPVEKAFEELLK